jgi:hypothetical protein
MADLPKLVSRHSLSGSQVLEMVDPLQAHLEALCARGSEPQVGQFTHLDYLKAFQILGCLGPLSVVPRRRPSVEVLWARGLAASFRFSGVPSTLALVRGLAAYDIHPGEETVVKLVVTCLREAALERVVEQITDMQDAITQGRLVAWGLEGEGGGAEGERFLRDLLEHYRRAQSVHRR